MFAGTIHTKEAALNNAWDFIDGTVRPISRPRIHQRIVYNGHKRQHALKYQSITTPNGMIANLYGPIEGKRHDAKMMRISGLMPIIENYPLGLQHERPCINGDPAYSLKKQPSRGFLKKRCSENMQLIYRRTPMPKCYLQLYWNLTSVWVFSCKFAAYFQKTFSKEHLWMAASAFRVFLTSTIQGNTLYRATKSYQW